MVIMGYRCCVGFVGKRCSELKLSGGLGISYVEVHWYILGTWVLYSEDFEVCITGAALGFRLMEG